MVVRTLASAVLLTSTLFFALACDGGYSNSEAVERCNTERLTYPDCMTTETTAACVTCFEDCGDACAVVGTVCPTQFECIED